MALGLRRLTGALRPMVTRRPDDRSGRGAGIDYPAGSTEDTTIGMPLSAGSNQSAPDVHGRQRLAVMHSRP